MTAAIPAVARPRRHELCVVAPTYNEELNLEQFWREVSAVLAPTGIDYAFLFVDDGSRDATSRVLTELRARDPRVRWVRLARNFGLQAALTAGLAHSDGGATVLMDADLQDDPAALAEMIAHWRTGADVVYAIRASRQEHLLKRMMFAGFHRVMSAMAEPPVPRDAGSFALYSRRVVDHINALPERNRYLPGLRAWVGFRQVGIVVPRRARHAGAPAQSVRRLIALALDGIFSFSKAPLRFASILGVGVTALSFIGLLVVAYWRFVQRSFPSGVGQATIALALFFLGGVQLLVLGAVGEYLGRVYDEVKQRPSYIVAEWCGEPVAREIAPQPGEPGGRGPQA